jgi:two-component system, OmpR family, KDP operon response regulator KdpE
MSERPLILVVEDSDTIREVVSRVLVRGGYDVIGAPDGEEGVRLFESRRPDLVVLDVRMPKMDGWEVLEKIRAWSDKPVLVLSGEDEQSSKVRMLMRGADDYVVKPANAAELLARVAVLLRRSNRRPDTDVAPGYDDGLVRVDLPGRLVQIAGSTVQLSPLEFKVLSVLVRRPGAVVTKEELMRDVWGDHPNGPADSVKLYMGYLRRKLEQHTSEPLIETVRGAGYRWMRVPQANGTPVAPGAAQ